MKTSIGIAALLAAGLCVAAGPALALQASVTQIDSNSDGSKTYHFAIALDAGDKLAPGAGAAGDFVTLYNFYGLVEGSAKSPPGWTFSSEEFGRTPTLNGYPMVLPVDVPNTPNLTWAPTGPVAPGAPIEGFAATTKAATATEGEYAAQVTREAAAVKGVPAGAPALASSKQALLGRLLMPGFLAAAR